jgi:hypothetical protein
MIYLIIILGFLIWGFRALAKEMGKPIEIPIFTAEMLGGLPISSRTEAKQVYRGLLEGYHIVAPSEVARCVDMLSHDIETAVWGVKDDVRYTRENVRDSKNELRDAQSKLRKAKGTEKDSILNYIDSLKDDLAKCEQNLAETISARDSFIRDKRNYIANHINCLVYGADWAFTPGPVKYFIYRDFKGNVTARSITNMQSDVENVTGYCMTRDAERTFKRYRILAHATDKEDLLRKLAKYQLKEKEKEKSQQGDGEVRETAGELE